MRRQVSDRGRCFINMFNYKKFCETRHISWMVPIATGLIAVAVGIALMYMLPQYIISILNSTGLFSAAQVSTANAQIATVQALGFLVIIIGLLWVVIGVISEVRGPGGV